MNNKEIFAAYEKEMVEKAIPEIIQAVKIRSSPDKGAKMHWTKEPPRKAGYYWAKHIESPDVDEVVFVYDPLFEKIGKRANRTGFSESSALNRFMLWSNVPIPYMEEPPDAARNPTDPSTSAAASPASQ